MNRSAIILAGGFSSRFGQNKGLVTLKNKPLIQHVIDATCNIVDETIIVVSSKTQAEDFTKVTGSETRVIIDINNMQGPLVGASTGFEKAHGKYLLLLPCDTPLISKDILSLLFQLCTNKNAAIPRWPNGYIEPLQSVYQTKPALKSAKKTLDKRRTDMRSMIRKLQNVHYVPTTTLQQLDPELKTFFNVNKPADLKKAESLLK